MRKTISVALLLIVAAFGTVATLAAPAKAHSKTKTETAVGEVTAVDPQAKTLSLKVKDETQRFTLNQNANLTSNGKAVQLSDLKVGEKVEVWFTREGAARNVSTVQVKTEHPKAS